MPARFLTRWPVTQTAAQILNTANDATATTGEASAAEKVGIKKMGEAKLDQIIEDELDQIGFSPASIIGWILATLLCAVLLVAIVLVAQGLFFHVSAATQPLANDSSSTL